MEARSKSQKTPRDFKEPKSSPEPWLGNTGIGLSVRNTQGHQSK